LRNDKQVVGKTEVEVLNESMVHWAMVNHGTHQTLKSNFSLNFRTVFDFSQRTNLSTVDQ
jgi:hypothetical protein